MQIAAPDANLRKILGQILRHALRQRGHQHALVLLRAHANLFQQVIHLALHGTDFHLGVHQARWPNHLLHDHSARLGQLIWAGRCGHVHHLIDAVFEFFKRQWPVVQRRRHSKAVIHESLLARAVTVKHSAYLPYRLVRFINEHQVVLRHVIQQRRRRFAGQTAAQMPRIILDAVAVANGAHHLDVKHGALYDTLRLDEFSLLLHFFLPPPQLFLNAHDGAVPLFLRHHVMRFRINRHARQILLPRAHFSGYRIDLPQRIDLVSPHFDAVTLILIRGIDFDHVSAHAKRAAPQVLAALVLNIDEPAQQRFARSLLSLFQHDQHAVISFRRAEAVNAGYGGHDHNVAAFKKGTRRTHAQLV